MQNTTHKVNPHPAAPAEQQQKQAGTAMLLSSLLFTAFMAAGTCGVTAWLSSRWAAQGTSRMSPLDLLASLVFLLDAVAVIRLVCFAAMLLSAERKDEAADLMPALVRTPAAVRKSSVLKGQLTPSPAACKRIGAAVLLSACSLCIVAALCVHHLFRLQ